MSPRRYLSTLVFHPRTIDVVEPGTHTTIQDYPGRIGYWEIGVPPSGPMDHLALRLANRLVGNDEGASALECTVSGPKLKFHHRAIVCVAGADMQPEIDGRRQPMWEAFEVQPGETLKLQTIKGARLPRLSCGGLADLTFRTIWEARRRLRLGSSAAMEEGFFAPVTS